MPAKSQRTIRQHMQALKDFNERVERIRGFGISRLAEAGRLRTTAQVALGDSGPIGARHPSQEEIDAFVNSLRCFIQDKEGTSLSNLAEAYTVLPLPTELKQAFAHCREQLKHWLKSKTSLGMDHAPLEHRHVFETFVYGDIAHQDEAKRQQLERWRQSPPSSLLFDTMFVKILGRFWGFLRQAAALNKKALRHLTA